MLLITLPLNFKLYIHFTILVLKRMIFTCRQIYTHMLLIFSTLLIQVYSYDDINQLFLCHFSTSTLLIINLQICQKNTQEPFLLKQRYYALHIQKTALLFLLYVSYLFHKTIWLNANHSDFKDVPTNASCLLLPSCTKKFMLLSNWWGF